VIEARNLVVVRGARKVLDAVDFSTERAGSTCILGPNGAGKSTLLLALAGLLPLEAGTVELDGVSLATLLPRERAKRLAYVPQRTSLHSSLHVETVVAHGRYAHTTGMGRPGPSDVRAIEGAMERTDVARLRKRRFDQLSTGERRRVLLARALATEAKNILLDEPTAALDIRYALELHALLRELASDGHSIVVVLHGLDAALKFTDRATLLDAGVVVASGPTREVVDVTRVREVYGVELIEGSALGFELGADT